MDERVAYFQHRRRCRRRSYGAAGDIKRPTPPAGWGPAAAKSQPAAAKQKPAAAPKRTAAGNGSGGPVGRMQVALASAVNQEPDWKEF